jgi:hypothetical protein
MNGIEEKKIEQIPDSTTILEQLYMDLISHAPILTKNFFEGNASEQKAAFLSGEIREPKHTHPKLTEIDFDQEFGAIRKIGQEIQQLFINDQNNDLNPRFANIYQQVVDTYQKKLRMIQLVRDMDQAEPANRQTLEEEYMQLNGEIYGYPDENVYRSLLGESLQKIASLDLTEEGDAAKIRDELFEMVGYNSESEPLERFCPSEDTVKWMQGVAESLYGGMLSHAPEHKDSYSPTDIKNIFDDIIRQEFSEIDENGNAINAAEGWMVELIDGKGPISVRSTEKKIVIPRDREDISGDKLKDLIVHELGVHLLRSIMGEETDLYALAHSLGVQSAIDADESLGKVMEQARRGKFSEAGIGHYITIGAAYFDHKDSRDVFELKWRLKLLESLTDGGMNVDDQKIADAKEFAYTNTDRIFQGPDNLPLFKDLSYYKTTDMWKYLETIRGDDLKFLFVLIGKQNPADLNHERIVYETKSK